MCMLLGHSKTVHPWSIRSRIQVGTYLPSPCWYATVGIQSPALQSFLQFTIQSRKLYWLQ
jgi:hypothetical protein